MRSVGIAIWVVLGSLGASGCLSDDKANQPSTTCSPGQPVSCACGGLSSGTISCEDYLAGTGTCMCPTAGAGGASGGMGGMTGGLGGVGGMTGGAGGLGGAAGMTGGTGGVSGMSGGIGGAAGMTGGMGGMTGGMGEMTGGMGGMTGGMGGDPGAGETGVLVGFTAAHNAKRAMVDADPPLGPLTWDDDVALVAQDWAETLADACANSISHRPPPRMYGENIAAFFGFGSSGTIGTAEEVVDNWYDEVECWTYGTIAGTEQCDPVCIAGMNSNGCGHYTQVAWRDTQRVGCGYASCDNGAKEYWVCNYDPPGNYQFETPY